MGAWNVAIDGNDTFLDVYSAFFDSYNEGNDPKQISKQIQENLKELFNDPEDKFNSFFGLALAQWETKSLDPLVFNKVKDAIELGKDLEIWRSLEADEKTINKRKSALDKFLLQISSEREKPKRRTKPKFEHSAIELAKISSPDGKLLFEMNEYYVNGKYDRTGSGISWGSSGGSVFYFTGQGKNVAAKWLDNLTLEVTHPKEVKFDKNDLGVRNVTIIYRAIG